MIPLNEKDMRPGSVLIGPDGKVFEVAYCYRRIVKWWVFSTNGDEYDLSDCRPVPLSEAVLRAAGFRLQKTLNDHAWYKLDSIGAVYEFNFLHGQFWCEIEDSCGVPAIGEWAGLHEVQNFIRDIEKFDLPIDLAAIQEAIEKGREG
jgi:hypothetical protein